MRKCFFLACCLSMLTVATSAQIGSVGVGTNTPNSSAQLDIFSNNKGLLIPRLQLASLSDGETVSQPATGLLVFNTSAVLPGGVGFYYNAGSPEVPSWTKLQTGSGGSSGNAWSITGNAGTDSTVNYIGTSDSKPIVFKIKSRLVGQIGAAGGISFGRGANGLNRATPPELIAIGDSALFNTEDSFSIAIGSNVLYSNTFGTQNIGLGHFALSQNTFGLDNVAIGHLSMTAITDGLRNTALGNFTMSAMDTGFANTAIGFGVLNSARRSFNTAVGYFSMLSDSAGANNAALGAFSLTDNIVGNNNTAIGHQTMASMQVGSSNTAVGQNAMLLSGDGFFNSALGWQALVNNLSGTRNTAIGTNSMFSNTLGGFNTAVGRSSLIANTTGVGNVAVGNRALGTLVTGNFNTAIGDSADVSSEGTAFFNTTAIGNKALVTASNSIVLGNTAITSIRGQVNFSTFSDGRYKQNVSENVGGLDFIMQLRPVTYQYNFSKIRGEREGKTAPDGDAAIQGFSRTKTFRGKTFTYGQTVAPQSSASGNMAETELMRQYNEEVKRNDQIRYTGFIAQEVEEAAKKAGFEFSGVDKPKNATDPYALRYAEFVVPLVKAVQEQQQIIKNQQTQIELLIKRIEALEGK